MVAAAESATLRADLDAENAQDAENRRGTSPLVPVSPAPDTWPESLILDPRRDRGAATPLFYAQPLRSMDIFNKHVRWAEDGRPDASGIISCECYSEWLQTRKTPLKNPALTFVQTLRGHITADPKASRQPFEQPVEADLLRLLRRKQVWPCFQGTRSRYGARGMKITGFHERAQLAAQEAADDLEAIHLLISAIDDPWCSAAPKRRRFSTESAISSSSIPERAECPPDPRTIDAPTDTPVVERGTGGLPPLKPWFY